MLHVQRRKSGRIIAGVCQGLGEAWGVDPLLLRIAFVALALINGVGVGLYIMAWLLLPSEDSAGRAFTDRTVREGVTEMGQRAREAVRRARSATGRDPYADPWRSEGDSHDTPLVSGLAIIGLGLLILLHNVGALAWLTLGKLLPLVMIFAGTVILIQNLRRA